MKSLNIFLATLSYVPLTFHLSSHIAIVHVLKYWLIISQTLGKMLPLAMNPQRLNAYSKGAS